MLLKRRPLVPRLVEDRAAHTGGLAGDLRRACVPLLLLRGLLLLHMACMRSCRHLLLGLHVAGSSRL